MWVRVRKSLLVLTTVSVVAVLAAATLPGLIAPAEGATAPPWVKMGYKDGPISVPASMGQIAAMSLPAGKYIVSAKGVVSATATYVDCRLRLGNSWDDGFYGETFGTIALNVATTLTATRTVTLSCAKRASNGSANVAWIKITAIRAGTLSVVQLQ